MKITKRWGARCRASQKGYPLPFSTKALPATGLMAFLTPQEQTWKCLLFDLCQKKKVIFCFRMSWFAGVLLFLVYSGHFPLPVPD